MTEEEIEMTVQHMANGKAPGPDGIPNEIIKYGGKSLIRMIYPFLSKCWNEGSLPEEMKRTRIFMIPKKGNSTDPANLRPIALNQCFFRVYDKVVLDRLNKYNE